MQALDDRITPTFTFAAGQDFGVGAGSYAVSVADFNGDGRADIVTADRSANTVSVLLNTTATRAAAPSFATKQAFAVGSDPISVSVGDFNSDGRIDIATANSSADTVSVLLNTTVAGATTPTFAAKQDFTVGVGPISVSVGDFNGDGRADLAVANGGVAGGGNTVSVLLNATAMGATVPAFTARQDFTVWISPSSVAVADFSGDGRADFAVVNQGRVSVLVNTTVAGAVTPTFASNQDFAVGNGPISVSVGDFNGDGRADLATANYNAGTMSVLRNATPAGAAAVTFAASQDFAVGGLPRSVSVADFNGDGRADLATANASDGTASVLLNATTAGAPTLAFASRQAFRAGDGPVSVSAGDFNGDGRADLVTVNFGAVGTEMTVTVLSNTSTDLLGTTLNGQFGTTGVWGYHRETDTWANLAPANADALATAPNGNVVANFGGNGVWYYRPASGWTRINGIPASAVAIDRFGTPFASFNGYGTAVYRFATGSWDLLPGTGASADKLAVSENGDVFANFTNYGVYRFRWTTGWQRINGVSASSLAVDPNGSIVASFNGYGVGQYIPYANGWRSLSSSVASAVAMDGAGNVYAALNGFGLSRWNGRTGTWTSLGLGAAATSLAADWFGNVFVSVPGYGVFEYEPWYGVQFRRNVAATLLALGR